MNSPDNLTSMSVFLTSVRQLQTIGVELLHAIHNRVKGWTDDRTIGDIFCRYGRLFDLYSVFSDAQEFAASGVVSFAKRSRDFADFVGFCWPGHRRELTGLGLPAVGLCSPFALGGHL